MLPRPPIFFWLTRPPFPPRARGYFRLGSASIQDRQRVAAASANPVPAVIAGREAIHWYKRANWTLLVGY